MTKVFHLISNAKCYLHFNNEWLCSFLTVNAGLSPDLHNAQVMLTNRRYTT